MVKRMRWPPSQIQTVIWKSHALSPDAQNNEPLAKFPGNAKPDIDVRIRWIIVIAIRRRSVTSIVIERPAPQHPEKRWVLWN
jgi:hypothetical protein